MKARSGSTSAHRADGSTVLPEPRRKKPTRNDASSFPGTVLDERWLGRHRAAGGGKKCGRDATRDGGVVRWVLNPRWRGLSAPSWALEVRVRATCRHDLGPKPRKSQARVLWSRSLQYAEERSFKNWTCRSPHRAHPTSC